RSELEAESPGGRSATGGFMHQRRLTVDQGDKGTPRMVDRLIRSGAIEEDQVLYSDPDFEQHNFSEDEIAAAEAALLGTSDVPHSISKPKRAEWMARNILVPEVATGSTERPITRFLQTVLDQAQRVRYFRPKYHPNLWGEDKGFPSVRRRPD
ncbi:MAG: hypothetical protein O2894_13430, partial [Planctomycetota bacterium]|nr:hypothetical protein [Planctomycetota bacterium]